MSWRDGKEWREFTPTPRPHRPVRHDCDVGCRPICETCKRAKKPVGRDAPAAMGGDLCSYDCPGYWVAISPCDLWPGERREPKEPLP